MRNFINKKAMNVKSDRFLSKNKNITPTVVDNEVKLTVVEPAVVVPEVIETPKTEVKKKSTKNRKKNKENNDLE